MDTMARAGLIGQDDLQPAKERIVVADGLDKAVENADFVVEAVKEDYGVKGAVYQEISRAARPEVVLASSSSGLLMSRIQEHVENPERSLIAHPFNPPHLVPLVELVPGRMTASTTLYETKTFFESLGKIPVTLNKEMTGHIANRLAAAVWREAIHLVNEGVASVEDVDKALYAGPGLRWSFMGQHLIYHLGGGQGGLKHFMDHLLPAMETWWADLADWTRMPEDAPEKLLEGVERETGGKSMSELVDWRDDRLIRIVKAIYQ
jgi:3-hydroxyacyl-CoA dehydrogenase